MFINPLRGRAYRIEQLLVREWLTMIIVEKSEVTDRRDVNRINGMFTSIVGELDPVRLLDTTG